MRSAAVGALGVADLPGLVDRFPRQAYVGRGWQGVPAWNTHLSLVSAKFSNLALPLRCIQFVRQPPLRLRLHLQSVGLSLSAPRLTMSRRRDGFIIVPAVLSKETAAVLEEAAYMREIKRKEIERVLALIGVEGEGFLANILDDMNL